MKAVKTVIDGKIYHLAFNGEAMFAIRDEFGGVDQLIDAIKPDTRDAAKILCAAVAILAEQGELVRRHYGYTPADIPTAAALERIITPPDLITLRMAIPQAISLGFGREIKPENDEVDLGLSELNEKKTS